jgi:hypothetical protein
MMEEKIVRLINRAAAVIPIVLSVCAISIQRVHAQGDPALAGPPPFKADYAFGGPAECLNSASAACRRKHRSQSPSNFNTDFAVGPVPEGGIGLLRVRGSAAAVQLDARRSRITDVLSALGAAFDISYRTLIVLDEERDGRYSGSLRHVISRVLDGYDYVIDVQDSKLDILIVSRHGERPLPVVLPVNPYHPLRDRRRPSLS